MGLERLVSSRSDLWGRHQTLSLGELCASISFLVSRLLCLQTYFNHEELNINFPPIISYHMPQAKKIGPEFSSSLQRKVSEVMITLATSREGVQLTAVQRD